MYGIKTLDGFGFLLGFALLKELCWVLVIL